MIVNRKIDKNLKLYNDWSGLTSANYTPVSSSGTLMNSSIKQDTGPQGYNAYVYYMSGITSTGATYGGGLITGYTEIDPTKRYRVSCWINRVYTGTTANETYGNFYHYNSSQGYLGNYYFFNWNASTMNTNNVNGWFLLVGYLMETGWTGNTTAYQGKIYYGPNYSLTGTSNATNFSFGATSKYIILRLLSPFNTTSDAVSKYCYPRIDLVDGTEPSINWLLTHEGPKQYPITININGKNKIANQTTTTTTTPTPTTTTTTTTPLTVTDYDGNVYNTVTISGYTYITESLRTTRDISGNTLNYTNSEFNFKLYSTEVVPGTQLISGWHIPYDYEWRNLCKVYGVETINGTGNNTTYSYSSNTAQALKTTNNTVYCGSGSGTNSSLLNMYPDYSCPSGWTDNIGYFISSSGYAGDNCGNTGGCIMGLYLYSNNNTVIGPMQNYNGSSIRNYYQIRLIKDY